jgi:putative nucleotidyltransferase with HDIG domain
VSLWERLERVPGTIAPTRRRGRLAYHGSRAGLALALGILTYLLFPASPAVDFPLYEIGSVAADNVIAPFAFQVRKTDAELARERDELSRAAQPIFAYVPEALDTARTQFRRFVASLPPTAGIELAPAAATAAVERAAQPFGLQFTPTESAYLLQPRRREQLVQAVERIFSRWLGSGVAPSGVLDNVRGNVIYRREGEERSIDADSIMSFGGFLARARLLHPDAGSPAGDAVFVKLLSGFFHPTIALDRAATARQREVLRESVDESKYDVRVGEKIVGAHEVVGREEYEKLRALQEQLQHRREGTRAARRASGAVLFNFLVIAIFGTTLILFRPQIYRSYRALALSALIYALVLAGGAIVSRGTVVHPELIPVALAAIMFSVLFDPRISVVAAMILAVLIGGQSVFRGTNALFLSLIGGVAAAVSVRVISRRNQVYRSILIIAVAYLLASVAIGLTLNWPLREILSSAGWGALNALIAVPVAMALLPLAEEFTGIDTYLRLLEWSDLNRPLMQRLSLEAPGTYAHTIAIANLAEAAANAIGANGLLARVGAYYHDIGKLKKPQYFVENQPKGRNPHDKLKPSTSAQIIRNHVREGLELAEEYRVPRAIRDFITEHHGTGAISYFLEKARERDGAVHNANEFAYPGPLPQSPETAIVMLADGVEAATKVLQEPTPEKIREVIDHIVRMRVEAGQLREAPLTLRQIEVIKEQFARVLIGMYHSRIDYPTTGGGVTSEFASL